MFPQLKGEYLTGRPAELPKDSAGRIAFLAVGFTYDSRFAVEEWVKHFRSDFGKREGVTFFEIPMVGGLARLGRWFINRGMRSGTPAADHEHVITVYGGTGEWKKALEYGDEDAAYLFLLDRDGRVVWQHSGKYDAAVFQVGDEDEPIAGRSLME